MGVHFEHAGSTDVTITNPRDILYIRGNETTDGSIRFHFLGEAGETEAHIELRGDDTPQSPGVWNDTGLVFSGGSINLGRDLRATAVGKFLASLNASSDPLIDPRSIYPNFEYTPAVGTQDNPTSLPPKTGFPIMPVLKPELFQVFPLPSVSEDLATSHTITFPTLSERVIFSTTHQTGVTAPTAEVEVTYTDNGVVINRFRIPSSQMPPNAFFSILFSEDFGFGGANILQTFTSANAFSLRKNAAGDFVTTQDGWLQKTVDIILEEFVITDDLSLLFTNPTEGDPIGNDPFFIVNNRFP